MFSNMPSRLLAHSRHSIAAAATKSLQSCLTLCDPIDGSPPGSPVPLEWVAISFSNSIARFIYLHGGIRRNSVTVVLKVLSSSVRITWELEMQIFLDPSQTH